MVHLEFLNGPETGRTVVVRRFPFCAGRSPGTHLQIEAKGVWDQHLALTILRDGAVRAVALPGALLTINGQSTGDALLTAGDVLGLGALQLRFSLAPVRARSTHPADLFVWVLVALAFGAEATVLYWLLT